LDLMGGLPFSEHVMLALIGKGLARERAYRLVQRCATQAWEGQSFLDCLLKDPEIREHLSEEEMRQCLDLNHHLRHLEETYTRVFGAEGGKGEQGSCH
jgi:Adenylosuccinate lyase (EC 4.3.2.2)